MDEFWIPFGKNTAPIFSGRRIIRFNQAYKTQAEDPDLTFTYLSYRL